jgi:uncharacterized protein YaaR (DUF327 family)
MPGIDVLAAQQAVASQLASSPLLSSPPKSTAPGARGKTAPRKSAFQALFETQTPELIDLPEIAGLEAEAAVALLKDQLDVAGQKLTEQGTTADFAAYRTAVQHFVKYVVTTNLTVDNEVVEGRPKRDAAGVMERKKKVFTRIGVIDEKLEQLATEVLMNHRDTMAILAKIHEINGLVVDLLS